MRSGNRRYAATSDCSPPLFDTARGSLLIGEDGSEYIDFFAGAGTLNYGHNNPLFKQALLDYIERDGIIHALDLATRAKREFIETFRDLVLIPRGLRYKLQFTGPTGANATEAAIKVARLATGRTNVIAFTRGVSRAEPWRARRRRRRGSTGRRPAFRWTT